MNLNTSTNLNTNLSTSKSKSKMKMLRKMMFLVIPFVLYSVVSLLGEYAKDFVLPFGSLIPNLLSIITISMAGLVIVWQMKHLPRFHKHWWLLAGVSFSWALTDTLWLIYDNIMNIDPNESMLIFYLYTLPNIFLLITVIAYLISNIKRWHYYQLILDIVTSGIVIGGLLLAIVVTNVDLEQIEIMELIAFFIYIGTDILALVLIIVMITSARNKKPSITQKTIIAGIFLYTVTDFGYSYHYFIDAYVPNSPIDITYAFAIILLGFGAIIEEFYPTIRYEVEEGGRPANFGKSIAMWWLALAPIIAAVIGLIEFRFMLMLFAVIILHQFFSIQSQKAVRTEMALKNELDMKLELERLIEERTKELKKANEELEIISLTDSLTGLINRRCFMERIEASILENIESFAIFYMDLDRFKVINDLHGHAMGDKVLIAIAERFKANQCQGCQVARLGGDEFAIIYPKEDTATLIKMCRDIVKLLEEPIIIGAFKFYIGVSIGIARYPKDAETADLLLKYADIAMYHVKSNEQQLDKFAIYSAYFVEKIERRNKIELILRTADFENEFKVYYQPQFEVATGRLIGAEALIRWFHPTEGFIPPGEFISISEENGMILRISDWVFEKGMRQIKEWNETYNLELTLGLNLSPVLLDTIDFYERLRHLIAYIGIKPEWIDFEITENSAMNTTANMEELFGRLTDLGVFVSIDDFGTGYSSLSYIKRFDVDTLKIAKELIDNLVEDSDDRLIVHAIIMMAEGMGLRTIAEGVETQEQYDILKSLGCSAIQGYLLGRPVPPEEFRWLK